MRVADSPDAKVLNPTSQRLYPHRRGQNQRRRFRLLSIVRQSNRESMVGPTGASPCEETMDVIETWRRGSAGGSAPGVTILIPAREVAELLASFASAKSSGDTTVTLATTRSLSVGGCFARSQRTFPG